MSQHEKLPYIRPPSPVPEAGEGSTKLHRYFVVSTFAAYFTLDVVSKILAVHRYGRSLSESLYLFYANVIDALVFAQYTMREKTPRYNRLLSYYFVVVGFLYPLAVGASILVESVQGNDPFMYFGRGYQGAQITYCSSVRTYADFGYGLEHEIEDCERPRRFCRMLSITSTIMVLYLTIGFSAVRWVTKTRTHGQTE